ncbi:MAG TPA: ABC transporter permease subunit [Candidatus Acidoferrum sp.]|nr:ABC transporter permease subunit [Candidatus Acidoferrum sp.]
MNRSRRLKLRIFRTVVLVLMGAFFLVPIGAMLEFSTRGNSVTAPRTLEAWVQIAQTPGLVKGIVTSLQLAVITSIGMLVLLLPTMVWVRLRLPVISRIVEFICLLPLTVPAIALVVGLKPLYIWININVTPSVLALSFAYLILVLPYSYRSLDAGLAAIDLKTLSEAARSLGAGWGTVMWRIVIPNMPSAILNAMLLSVALVLGEYTVANLLNFQNLQVEIAYVGLVNAGTSIAVAVGALLLAFILLMVLTLVGGRLQQQHYVPGQRA